MLEAARKNDVERYIQVSSDETYGSIKGGSFKEDDSLNPSSPYSASKAGADLLVGSYNRTYNLPTLITRSSNNYGPYQFPEKIIPLFITNLMQNKKVPLYGNGLNIRDWLFVSDNCIAVDTVLHKGKIGEIYNIASSEEKTNLEITKMLLNLLGKSEGMIQFVEDRKGHDFRYSMDSSKIRKLGWEPKVDFRDGLKATVEWYKNNEWWLKSIR
jgi:dTDP-glucose 4,6-dehydratase